MSDIPYGFEKPVAKTLHDMARAGGQRGGNAGGLPEQRRVAIALSPVGGIPARSGATPGTATCTLYQISSGSLSATTNTETVYNLSAAAVSGSAYIAINREYVSGQWVVIMESCETP